MKTKRVFSAVVPVAGTGTRLRPHTHTYPKVLLTVGHKPILGHILDQLLDIGTPKVCLVIGYLGEKIKDYVSSAYPSLDVTYVEQKEPLGLGHAVALTENHVRGPVFILLGDTIISADMSRFVRFDSDCIGVREVEDPRRFGVVETKKGYISRITEKPRHPASNMAVVGAYSFTDSSALYSSLRNLIRARKTTKGEIQLTDAIQSLIASGRRIRPVVIQGWYDCGKPSTLLATNRYILGRHKCAVRRAGSLIIQPAYISRSAKISDSIIGPYVSIGDMADISHSIVANSIINEKARIKNMLLRDSLIGPSAALTGRTDQINIGENSEINFECGEDAGKD